MGLVVIIEYHHSLTLTKKMRRKHKPDVYG
jgi:hypothetical protein